MKIKLLIVFVLFALMPLAVARPGDTGGAKATSITLNK